jgi:hypothetical protein
MIVVHEGSFYIVFRILFGYKIMDRQSQLFNIFEELDCCGLKKKKKRLWLSYELPRLTVHRHVNHKLIHQQYHRGRS